MADQTANNPTSVHDESATIFVAVELSLKSWLVGIRDPLSDRVSQYSVATADVAKLLELINKRIAKVERVLAMPVQVRSCYEAGYEGVWLHRCLLAADVHNVVIDPLLSEHGGRIANTAGAACAAPCTSRPAAGPSG